MSGDSVRHNKRDDGTMSIVSLSLTSDIIDHLDEILKLGIATSWNEVVRHAIFIAIDKYDFIWHRRDWEGEPIELLPMDNSGHRVLTTMISIVFKCIIDYMVERKAFPNVSIFVRNAILELLDDFKVNLGNYQTIAGRSGRSGRESGRSGRSGRKQVEGLTPTRVAELFEAGKISVNFDDDSEPEGDKAE